MEREWSLLKFKNCSWIVFSDKQKIQIIDQVKYLNFDTIRIEINLNFVPRKTTKNEMDNDFTEV